MRVTFRSGAILLALGVFLTGCSESGSTPSQGTSSAKPGPVASAQKTTEPTPATTKSAEPDYVLGVSGMA